MWECMRSCQVSFFFFFYSYAKHDLNIFYCYLTNCVIWPNVGVHEVVSSVTLFLLFFFFFYCYTKHDLNIFYYYLINCVNWLHCKGSSINFIMKIWCMRYSPYGDQIQNNINADLRGKIISNIKPIHKEWEVNQ